MESAPSADAGEVHKIWKKMMAAINPAVIRAIANAPAASFREERMSPGFGSGGETS